MDLNVSKEWLLRMAEEEGNGIISVGGLVTRIKMATGEDRGMMDLITEAHRLTEAIEDRDRKARAVAAAALDVLHQLDYLQGLWGKEGITNTLAERLRVAIAEWEGPDK
jgi:hypothetical protein